MLMMVGINFFTKRTTDSYDLYFWNVFEKFNEMWMWGKSNVFHVFMSEFVQHHPFFSPNMKMYVYKKTSMALMAHSENFYSQSFLFALLTHSVHTMFVPKFDIEHWLPLSS